MDGLQHSKGKDTTENEAINPESQTFIAQKCKLFDDGLGSRWKFWRRRRHRVVLMIFLGEAVRIMLHSNLSIAVFPMTENYTITSENGTEIYVQDFDWDVKTRGFLLSAFYYGYIATNILGGILATKYGGASVFGYGVILTSITTLLTPILAPIHLYVLFSLQILEGLCEGILQPGMEQMLSRWIPVEERSSIVAIVTTGAPWGHTITVAACGAIGYYWGWEAIFYCTGSVGVVWFVAAQILVKEQPILDKTIPPSECQYIQNSLRNTRQVNRVSYIPYVKIITSLPVWASMIANFAGLWTYMLFVTQSPAYIKDVLKFDYKNAGYLSSLIFLGKVIVTYSMAPLADTLITKKILTTTATRKIFVCGGLSIMAIFGFLIQLSTSSALAIACLALILISSTYHVQIFVNALDMAPRYCSVLVGLYTTAVAVTGIITPTLTGYLTQNKTAEEWHTVFSIQSGICLTGALIYGVFASGQLQPWATEEDEDIPESENHKS